MCRERVAPRPILDTPRGVALAAFAGRRRGIVTAPELLALGFDRPAIRRLIAAGRLHRLFRGVYAVGHRGLSRSAQLYAAALACGPGAAISHGTAAHAWTMTSSFPSLIDVTVPTTAGRTKQPGLRIHRTRNPPPTRSKNGVRLTTPAETLRALAADTSQPALERLIDRALANRLLKITDLTHSLTDSNGRPGTRNMRAALEHIHPQVHRTRSELERKGLRILARAKIEKPMVNANRGPYELDLVWPGPRMLVIELDGYGFHRSAAAMNADLRRGNEVQAAGHVFRRFTWAHLVDDEPWVITTTRAALAEARA